MSEAETITTYLMEHNRTQAWLADILGVTRAAVSYWCSGDSVPAATTLRLMQALPETKELGDLIATSRLAAGLISS